MGWVAWTLVRLKHAVGEGILPGHLHVRSVVARRYVAVLWVGVRTRSTARHRDRVRAVHLTVAVHIQETRMRVVEIVGIGEWNRLQRYRVSARVESGVRNVGAGQAVEEIVRSSVLLNDDDDVLDTRRRCCGRGRVWRGGRARRRRARRTSSAAAAREAENYHKTQDVEGAHTFLRKVCP